MKNLKIIKKIKEKPSKISFFNFIFLLFSISLIFSILSIFGYYYYTEIKKIQDRTRQMQVEYEKRQRVLVKTEVENSVTSIYKQYEEFVLQVKDKLRRKTYEALAFIRFINRLDLPKDKKIKKIKEYLQFLSFYDGAIFYFLITKDGKLLLFPQNYTFEGKDVSSLPREYSFLLKTYNTHEEGLFEYPGKETNLVYIRFFTPLNLIVGTSVNLTMLEGGLKKRLLKGLSSIRYGERRNEYIFVIDYTGNVLASGFNKELVGKNTWNIKDKNGKKFVQDFVKIVKTKSAGFVKYMWKRPSSGDLSPKISFVEGIPMWGWIIGSGFYLDDIKEDLIAMEKGMKDNIVQTLRKMFYIAVFVLLFFMFVFLILKNLIRRDISKFINFFRDSIHTNKKIDTEKIVYDEFYKLAIYANQMLDKRMEIERKLKRREEFYAALVEDLPVMSIRFKKGCIFTFANKRYLDYFNVKLEDIVGKDFFPYILPEDRDKVVQGIKKISIENPTFVVQHRTNVNGQERWMEWINRGIFDKNGEIIEYSAVGRDITEEKRREEEYIKIQKLEALNFLAGGIAHDFNNILTGIMGKIGIAKLIGGKDSKLKEKLEEAEAATLRARDLANKLLTFSKGGEPVKEIVPISKIIKEEVLFSLHGSNVESKLEIPEDLWYVRMDRSQIGQVIQNLVINALQAMPNGGYLTISGENIILSDNSSLPLSPGKYVKIGIKDTGVGIPQENLKNIFDPYFTTKESGSGLGLAIVYSIIKKHNGHIEVFSQRGEGTEFVIYLPAVDEIPSPSVKSVDVKKIKRKTARILIMDDDELIISVLSDILSYLGHKVEVSRSGEEAIKLYKEAKGAGTPFDVVIMDLTIKGGMGGKDASREILKFDPSAKIVVSSGYSEDPIMAEYKRYGFQAVLKKPYTIEAVSTLLDDLLKDIS